MVGTTLLSLGDRFSNPDGDYIVLASEASIRAHILNQHLNVKNVLMMGSGFPEDLDKAKFATHDEYVVATADGKARIVAETIFGADTAEKRANILKVLRHPYCDIDSSFDFNKIKFVIGGDTVCSCGDEIFEKPADEKEALKQFSSYQIHDPVFITGISIYCRPLGASKPACTFSDKTHVKFQRMTPEDIDAYIKTKNYIGTAGSCRVTACAESLVERIEGSYTSIIGMPAQKLSYNLCKLANTLF
ncbi:Maf-like protein family protein [Babesia bovis T2Bo]|uniref:Maf-like protein family protein n=1 Tax=Babesia bovis TaxID=5865 RepID=A7AP75_BABBO|nr:Maf-like protein family protein [Babesia bovis T2Bo]EDO08359.1 Maf-like protein family protein [Babesia bovis T2Bo]|eukprot:XP_001611927.1 Maf-like protein family protein [Babesia bovis T2Bo]